MVKINKQDQIEENRASFRYCVNEIIDSIANIEEGTPLYDMIVFLDDASDDNDEYMMVFYLTAIHAITSEIYYPRIHELADYAVSTNDESTFFK